MFAVSCSGLFASLDPKIRNQILDELTYKLSISHSAELGRYWRWYCALYVHDLFHCI